MGAWWLAWRRQLFTSRLFLARATCAIPVGYVAVTAGWVTTEVGRQPYVVYGHLRTADAVTPFLTGGDVIVSLLVYITVYALVFGAGAYYLVQLVRRGFPARSRRARAEARRAAGAAAVGSDRSRGDAMTLDLVPIWTLILGVAVFMYVLLDGFDLGVGILFPFAPNDDARDLMMNSVAPIWDGNETWLVLGGIALFAAFPLAFAIIIPALYFPILAMLLGLIFRGVAFEFRPTAAKSRSIWDRSFFWGSLIATFAQGCVLGKFVQGFAVDGTPVRRHESRLDPSVRACGRRRARLRLRAARRDLARHEDRRRAAGLGAAESASSACSACSRSWRW